MQCGTSVLAADLQADREIVLQAAAADAGALQWASETLLRDKGFLIAALARSWEPIVWAADALLSDPEVVLLAVKQHAGALCWAAESLKSNNAILAAAATAPVWDARKVGADSAHQRDAATARKMGEYNSEHTGHQRTAGRARADQVQGRSVATRKADAEERAQLVEDLEDLVLRAEEAHFRSRDTTVAAAARAAAPLLPSSSPSGATSS